ncbi:MAG: transglutaminase TgpA family protein [Bacillota bacterium]
MVIRRPSAGYQLALALIAMVMVSIVLDSLAEFWRMSLPGSHLLLLSVASVLYGWLWWRAPWAASILTIAATIGSVLGIRYSPAYLTWLSRLIREGGDLYEHLRAAQFDVTFGPTLGLFLLAATALLAGLLITWEGFGRGSAFWSIVGGLLLFGTQWAWFFDKSASFFMGFVIMALVLWTVGQAAQRDAEWLSNGRRIGYRSHIATPLATVLVISLFGALLPYEFAPIHLGELGVKVQEAFPVLRELRGGGAGTIGGRFNLAVTGFSPNMGRLGGPVQPDDTVALYLTPVQPLTETIYLRGATFLVYTGDTWEVGESRPVEIPSDGNLPTNYATDVLREFVTFRVTPALNFGRTIFNVLEPMRVDDLKSSLQANADGNLYATRSIPRESTYTVTARLPRYSTEQIRLLGGSAPEAYYEPYLQLPQGLPQRVGDLAGNLTRGVNHPYDKAVRLESYFRGMMYDLQAPAAPPGRDFVDFFLFDLRRGYCTYFATGMVVMLRELGIPARLVEGYAVPVSADYTEDAQGRRTYSVLNSQAHAWVEAYFPGYGWVTFDPTPRDDLPTIARNTPAPDPSSDTASEPTEPLPEDLAGLENTPLEDLNEGAGFDTAAGPAAREWPWFLTPLLVLGLLFLAGQRYLTSQDRLASTEGRTLVQEVWEKAGGLLARFDFGRAPHQTPREYAVTLGEAFPPLKEPALQVAEDYTVARYGPGEEPVDEAASERAKTFWQRAHEELFNRYGWRTYLWRRLPWPRKKR